MDLILLSIGTEILKGRIANTNAQHMAARLFASGFGVREILSIGDTEEAIISSLEGCFAKAQVVIATGGLGPTRDDITKTAACRYFGKKLIFDEELFKKLELFFFSLGYKSFPELSRNQALVPEGATVLPNPRGTASGILFEEQGRLLFLLPGVPGEMKGLLDEQVLPLLLKRFRAGEPETAIVRTIGLGESVIAERIEKGLSEEELALLGYYPHGGQVDIVISGPPGGQSPSGGAIGRVADHVAAVLEGYVFSRDERSLLEIIGSILSREGKKLAVAESCTGGLLAKRITDIPGSSAWFDSGVVSYSNRSKAAYLGVPPELIEKCGAVSEEVAGAMAEGMRQACPADYALGITGIAGPTGGTPEKPAGTVYIALSDETGTRSQKYKFNGDREQVRTRSVIKAVELLWRKLKEDYPLVLP
ncbi:MAG: hypothetical protein A3F83_07760 [Candidatus Glassbacteria bacterium RIFCSPLOWO2_12_FULL_58_11]|uniref:CinA-like protein n=1 Tax=Candidatus Glassbacteria bacterium RIFCSPLOWO2_12_FULL_58_11 TaxID=1817867 RepID=A0A1F5YS28_9BACT|nr:MAG: hypothetical protein A3F83_07760 [Candidatus Glassbacteria bacterium RIFCSPLOWO2_12_FULL_58_11]